MKKKDARDNPNLVKAPRHVVRKLDFTVGGSSAEHKFRCVKCGEFLSQPVSLY